MVNYKLEIMTEGNFVDYVKIYVTSGKGGKGSTHLHREKFIEKGGPDGGDGGRGGHVYVKGNKNLWTLFHLKFVKHMRGGHGGDGGSSRSTGHDGEDKFVEVPLGTVVKDIETGEIICEITEHDEVKILAEGGKGGLGNWNFRSSTNQTPRYAQPGMPTTELDVILELKVLADVGLVGFPNAGKSTLLSVLTSAKPKIADYPFTTLKPNLGIVAYREFQSFVMADIPGIIEGAAEGKGLGHYFLRHIERNAALLFLVPADAENIKKEYDILLDELRRYNPEMLDKDRLLVISKSDMLDDELKSEIKQLLDSENIGIPYLFISSIAQQGLQELKDTLWKMLNIETEKPENSHGL
ncbi:MAG: GTP-binding protein [Flavobacterium sp.]|jgi:GTP-binding protein